MSADDTHPAIRELQLEGFRKMSPAEKLRRVEELTEAELQLAAARIRQAHPRIGDRELRLRLASLSIDRETMIRVFDWDPERQG